MNFKLASGTEAVIEHIEYDPNRSARIARIKTLPVRITTSWLLRV